MKLIHLSDLHLGKRLNEYSLLEDQKYILDRILGIIGEEQPDAVLLAGDIYDKSVPPVEAVELFDEFLFQLADRGLQVFVVSGNHDSSERLAFGSRLMDASGIHLSPVYGGHVEPFALSDAFGRVNIYMLPFVKPAHVRRYFPDEKIEDYTDALSVALNDLALDPGDRNVLIAHQFVTGAERSESEEATVGGLDNVDASVFDGFDYVALGHIHKPQNIQSGSGRIRYCGTPLKYSFSETEQKTVTVVELGEKGAVEIREVPLAAMRDLHVLQGKYDELMRKSFYEDTTYQEDYLHVVLTDEEEVPEALSRMRVVYKNIMKLTYDNTRTRAAAKIDEVADLEKKSPLDLFSEFYAMQNGSELGTDQKELLSGMIEKIWEDKA